MSAHQTTMERAPDLDIDLYNDEAILNPYPLYREIRDAGTAVWLRRHNAWAIGQFEDVRAALRVDSVLISGRGVAMNNVLYGYESFRATFRAAY